MSFLPSQISVPDAKTWLLLGLAIGTGWVVKRLDAKRKRNPRHLPLPPGPRGLPIIGNVLQIPTENPSKAYAQLRREYGDIMYLDAVGQGIVILGSLPRAMDVLEKRSANYSDRPVFPALEMMGMGWSLAMKQYGTPWRQRRRAFHQYLNQNMIPNYHPIMYEERMTFLRTLKNQPEDFYEHIRVFLGIIIMRATYGLDDVSKNKALIHNATVVTDAFMAGTMPGRFLVNMMPFLRHVPKWVPGAGFQTYFEEMTKVSDQVVYGAFDAAKKNFSSSVEKSGFPCLAVPLIDSLPQEGDASRAELESVARNLCADAYIAGADTTVSSALVSLFIMATNPEVQEKARAELDAVVGSDRLPNIDDRPSLPYLHAVIKEVGRWYTVVPLGIPHAATDDGEYDGYFIPKGTYMVPNSWAIMHDPELFDKPFEFNPERYLKDGQIDPTVLDPESAAFGFGRRICPGRHFSGDALFLLMASVLSSFIVSPLKDEAGNPLPMELKTDGKPIETPLPFKVNITLREGRGSLLN